MIDVEGNNMGHSHSLGQQRRKMFGVAGNNAEELPQRRTDYIFCASLLKGQFTEIKDHFYRLYPMPFRICVENHSMYLTNFLKYTLWETTITSFLI
jgi:hypothetical protein